MSRMSTKRRDQDTLPNFENYRRRRRGAIQGIGIRTDGLLSHERTNVHTTLVPAFMQNEHG